MDFLIRILKEDFKKASKGLDQINHLRELGVSGYPIDAQEKYYNRLIDCCNRCFEYIYSKKR